MSEIDSNTNFKFLGRQAMWNGERAQALTRDNLGGRKGMRSVEVSMNQRLLYDLLRAMRGRAVIMSNDAWGCFDRVVVSTDDEEIADVARANGAETPFMRPAVLSDDITPTIPVIAHAVAMIEAITAAPVAHACCIYATAPFVAGADLQRGLAALVESEADFAFSITSYAFPIQRAFRITDAGRIAMFQPELFGARSQDLEEAWHDAGQFYWGKVSAWLTGKPLFSHDAAPVPLPRHRVQDIDTPEDWCRAEWLFKAMRHEQGQG